MTVDAKKFAAAKELAKMIFGEDDDKWAALIMAGYCDLDEAVEVLEAVEKEK